MSRSTRSLFLVLAMASALVGAACQNPTSTSSSDTITLTASPEPTNATTSAGKSYTIKYDTKADETYAYEYKATVTITLKNSSKVGAKISSMTLKVDPASNGIVVSSTNGESAHYEYSSTATSNRVEGSGSTTITYDVWYTVPTHSREAMITISYSFLNDDDASFTGSVTARVNP